MAFSTKWEDHGVLWTYWGSLKAKDLIASNNEIYGDPRFDDIDYQIVDFRQVNENCLTMSDMRRIAFLDRAAARSNPRIRVAVVMGEVAGLCETTIYTANSGESPWEVERFSTMEAAREWLSGWP